MLNELKTRLIGMTKPLVRNALWKALVRIDDSLALRSPAARSSASVERKLPTTPLVTSIAPNLSANTSTLVLNEQGIVTTVEELRLVVECIFETDSLAALEQSLFERLVERPDLWAQHEGIVAFLRDVLIKMIERSGASADERDHAARALHQITVHERQTARSASAYTPGGAKAQSAIYWPDPTRPKQPRSLFDEMPFATRHPILDQQTPIGSAGSCFAMEIAHRLQADGFNYVITEPAPTEPHGYSNACARWGIIFNTPSFRQLVEFAFAGRPPSRLLWSLPPVDGKIELRDPFREDVSFSSLEQFEADSKSHQAAVREALLRCKVFVLTLGVNEVWRLKSDGSVFSRAPWRLASNLVESRVMTVEDNLRELQSMLDLWRRHNPEIKFVVSVSPVPLHATFRADDCHVITANAHSKATLRVVAEEFARNNRDVFYFPSYEVVMYCTKDAWHNDQRHVSRKAVERVMTLFKKMFVASGASDVTAESSARTAAII
jgi:hypothetical protein